MPIATASDRERASSLVSMFMTCDCTVRGLIDNESAISRSCMPVATSRSTANSRLVNGVCVARGAEFDIEVSASVWS